MSRHPLQSFDRYFAQVFRHLGRGYDFVVGEEIDFSAAQRVITAWSERGERVTLGAVMCHAVARGLAAHPQLSRWPGGRASFGDEAVIIGVPVHAPRVSRSFAVPVALRDAHRRSLPDLSGELARLGATARAGQVAPFDRIAALPGWAPVGLAAALLALGARISPGLARRTFGVPVVSIVPGADALTLTRSLGPCALAFGAVRERPVVRGGRVVAAPTALLSCAVDHRVASAGVAAALVGVIRRVIETEIGELAPAAGVVEVPV